MAVKKLSVPIYSTKTGSKKKKNPKDQAERQIVCNGLVEQKHKSRVRSEFIFKNCNFLFIETRHRHGKRKKKEKKRKTG